MSSRTGGTLSSVKWASTTRGPRSLRSAVVTFVIWALESLFEFLYGIAWRNLAQSIQHDLRVDAYRHLQGLDVEYFEDRSTGDLMAVLNDDVNQLERFLDIGANEAIQLLTTVVLIGAAFFLIAPPVAWLAFLPMPVILGGSLLFQKRIEPRYALVRDDAAAIRISAAFTPLIRIAILVGFTATLVWGGFLALDGTLNIGSYSVMVFLTQRLLWPLTRLGQTVDLYQRAMASTKRIFGVLDSKPSIDDGDLPASRISVDGDITFENIMFSYDEGHPVLSDVSLTISPASTTAFVGLTGSGKTTLIKLLLRFYDPDAGSIRFDGVDIRSFAQSDLRKSMALVSQDVFLFHGTVAENISFGAPDATGEEITEAARTAEAHDFIAALPNGYDTIVGERGQKLSGGQRRRLSLARALLTRSPVLILDEATSAVENETEAAIQRSLARIAHNRKMVVVAHRLSTIRSADVIYVIDKGRVTQMGTHDDLIAADGIYRTLWNVQTGEAGFAGRTS